MWVGTIVSAFPVLSSSKPLKGLYTPAVNFGFLKSQSIPVLNKNAKISACEWKRSQNSLLNHHLSSDLCVILSVGY